MVADAAGKAASGLRRLVAIGALAATVAGCAGTGPGSEAEDLAAIAEFNHQYLAALNAGDIDALTALTTGDHILIASGGAPLVGRQALVDAMTGAFSRFEFDETWTPEETVVSGDLAYQRGTFVVVATPKDGGEATRTTGNFLRIYRRQADGAWFMVRDMFNSSR